MKSAKDENAASGWVSTRHFQHFIARGEAAGLSVDEMLDGVDVTKSVLEDADGIIPLTALESMLSAISSRYSDPLIGLHIASDIQPATFGAVGFISQVCATFCDVIDAISRYNGLLSNIGETSISHEPGTVQVRWKCLAGGEQFQRQATEYVLGSCVVLARLLVPDQKELLHYVNFSHLRPDDMNVSREYFNFFQCPVYFDQPESSLVLPSKILQTKLRHNDAAMKELLERHADHLFQQRKSQGSLIDDVKRLIRSMMINGAPTKDKVAMQLGGSGRSLHRKLQKLNTSYQEILNQVRLEFASRRLIDSGDSVNKISAFLGFSTHQAFLRWFKKSIGMTPGVFRRIQVGE